MLHFFEYNWQVRDEWLDWCRQLSIEELVKERTGGVGSILYTLFHIFDVEYSWIRAIQDKDDIMVDFENYATLEKVTALSNQFRIEIKEFLYKDLAIFEDEIVTVPWDEQPYMKSEILHHIIAHEIHHIGQLSVWARELELNPVSANFIGRRMISDQPR